MDEEHKEASGRLKNVLATYTEAEDLINIGAYVSGSDPLCDKAIALIDQINDFLKQSKTDKLKFNDTITKLIELANLAGG